MALPAAQAKAVLGIVSAINAAIEVAGTEGAPGGILYTALMQHGFSLDQFETTMSVMLHQGLVTKRSHLYFNTPLGTKMATLTA